RPSPTHAVLPSPAPAPGPDGEPAFALLHRPMWDLSWANPAEGDLPPPGLPDPPPRIWVAFAPAQEGRARPGPLVKPTAPPAPRPGIWVSSAPAKEVLADPVRLTNLRDHRLVALPERPWEEVKLGGGTPPLPVRGGRLGP